VTRIKREFRRILKVGLKMDTSEKYIRMCESAKDIQRLWNFENGDYIVDLSDGETMVWFGYPPKEYIDIVWLPRQDQYQELCINFYIRDMGMSRDEAFFHFLGYYAGYLKESYDTGYRIGKKGEYEEIDSCEELMLKYTMMLIYWKRWDGENWVK
jgi:hypothetical protein